MAERRGRARLRADSWREVRPGRRRVLLGRPRGGAATTITYEDGRQAILKSRVSVEDVEATTAARV